MKITIDIEKRINYDGDDYYEVDASSEWFGEGRTFETRESVMEFIERFVHKVEVVDNND